MNELFVPYELALLAKEKGFDEPCIASFSPEYLKDSSENFGISTDAYWESHLSGYDDWENLPLYQQLRDWILKTFKIYIQIEYTAPRKFNYQPARLWELVYTGVDDNYMDKFDDNYPVDRLYLTDNECIEAAAEFILKLI